MFSLLIPLLFFWGGGVGTLFEVGSKGNQGETRNCVP